MRRLLITGGSGYLGQHLIRAAAGWHVSATYLSRPFLSPPTTSLALDLCQAQAVQALVCDLRPDAILHTACSNGSPQQVAAIVPAARNLAQAARQHGARLVHVSTDLVFDGEHAPYQDDAPPTPIMDYGRAKAEAERLVREIEPRAAIVRPSLIWGLDPIDRQTGWLVEAARAGTPVTLFTDEMRCPVYVHDLCAALLELAARPELSGPFNLGGPQALNRWDFGLRLLRALGVTAGPNVARGTLKESGLVRARDLTLHSDRAAVELQARLRGVDEVLAAPAAPPGPGAPLSLQAPAPPSSRPLEPGEWREASGGERMGDGERGAVGTHTAAIRGRRRPRYCEG